MDSSLGTLSLPILDILTASRSFGNGNLERAGANQHPGKRRHMLGNRVLLLGKQRELALYRAEFLRERGFE